MEASDGCHNPVLFVDRNTLILLALDNVHFLLFLSLACVHVGFMPEVNQKCTNGQS